MLKNLFYHEVTEGHEWFLAEHAGCTEKGMFF